MSAHPYFSDFLANGRVGVIDIGSNSIRLVVYDGIKRAPLPIINEKTLCELGRGMSVTGRLNADGVALAHRTLDRQLALVARLQVAELHVLATAAMREASDGPDFVAAIEKKHGVQIQVIEGSEEARLAALGVIAGTHRSRGLVGDLGGGSLELARITELESHGHVSLKLGGLRLLDVPESERRSYVTSQLDSVPWIREECGDVFYAVGGSFRALAKIHQMQRDYPLPIIHHYRLSTPEVVEMARLFQQMSEAQLAALPVPPRRAVQLPMAALVLEEVLARSSASSVLFSAQGIREGLLFDQLSPLLKKEDPLIAGAVELALGGGASVAYAEEVFRWMQPAFPHETEEQSRLRAAACLLSGIAWRIHPPLRGVWAFHHILHSNLTGIGHASRVKLGLALYHRHQRVLKEKFTELSLLSPAQLGWARQVGLAMGLAYHLSGGRAGMLPDIPLTLSPIKRQPKLKPTPELQAMLGDTVQKWLDGLGEAMSASSSMDI